MIIMSRHQRRLAGHQWIEDSVIITSVGANHRAATSPLAGPTSRADGDPASTYDAVAAAATSNSIPSAYDESWTTKNLSAQDKAVISRTTGITFGADGSVLVPMTASPNESYALEKTMHLLNSHRGGFPEDLTPEELLRLIEQNAPGSAPEPISDLTARLYARQISSTAVRV